MLNLPPSLVARVRRTLKDAVYHSPLARFLAPRWQFNHSPSQLAFMCECASRTRDVPGPVFEVGCFAGATTLFLSKHLAAEGIDKPYCAFATFEGFTAADVAHEVGVRGKRPDQMTGFTDNKQVWFDRTMALNGLTNVRSVRCDASTYDFASLPAPSFCLLDVDLYRPILAVLNALYDRLPKGAIIVVDDCAPGSFDGALQAFDEFVAARGLPRRIERAKLGVIEKA